MSSGTSPQAVRTLARQRAPAGIYGSKYSVRLAGVVLRRLSAGESLRAICRADVAMPTEKTVWNWRRSHPEFDAAYREVVVTVRARRRAAQAERDGRRRAEVMAGLRAPSGRVAWNRGRDGYGPDIAAKICDRLMLGMPIAEVCAPAWMPSVATVYNWLRRYPAFVEAYLAARHIAFLMVVEAATEELPWQGTFARSERLLERVTKAAHARCGKLAPRGLSPWTYGPQEG